jgi:hypothetical protein
MNHLMMGLHPTRPANANQAQPNHGTQAGDGNSMRPNPSQLSHFQPIKHNPVF